MRHLRKIAAVLTIAAIGTVAAPHITHASSIYGYWPSSGSNAEVDYGFHYGLGFIAVPDFVACDNDLYYYVNGQPAQYQPYSQQSGSYYPNGGSTLQFWCNQSFRDQNGASHTCYDRFNVPVGGVGRYGYWGQNPPDIFCTGNSV